jgi:agmatine/peptidylarginine deiminase
LAIDSLKKAKLNYIEIPYNPYSNKRLIQANGIYLNYLQMKGIVFLPIFSLKEDKAVIRTFKTLLKKSKIVPIDSNEIAN